MRRDPIRQRGFALLIVLWTLSLLSLLIAQLTGSGGQAVRLAGNLRAQAALQALADGAVQEAGFHLAAAGVAHWPADGAVRELRQDDIAIRLRITTEAGRVNPGIASLELMAALVHECGVELPQATAIATSINAWRFPTAQGGYGAAEYRQAGRAYAPPGQPFESLDELGLVLGMTPELLRCLTPHLSLFRDNDPDPNAADPLVLRALAASLGAPPGLSGAAPDESVVMISAVATAPDGARAARRAILRMAPRQPAPGEAADALAPFRIMQWEH